MKTTEIKNKVKILVAKEKALNDLESLLKYILKNTPEIPPPAYVQNIEKRILSLQTQFDDLLK